MPANLRPPRRRDDLPSVARLLTLSDNVVAIALTLLVFQLKVPATAQVADPGSAADLAAQLAMQADQLISYLIAFYGQVASAHHRSPAIHRRRAAGRLDSEFKAVARGAHVGPQASDPRIAHARKPDSEC